MRRKHGISLNILNDVKLSHQELLDYAADLSLVHKVYTKKLELGRINLSEERRNIEQAFLVANQCKYDNETLPAISEWFYDNRFLFVEQVKQIELQRSTIRLPYLQNGRFAHYPRSFALAIELVTHSSFDISAASIEEFLLAYQKETGLNSGELWIFVDMLKIALIYAVSALAKRSIKCIKMRRKANKFCEEIENDMLASQQLLNDYRNVLTNPVFMEHVMVRLRESPHVATVTENINRHLAVHDLSAEKLIKKAHAAQARDILYISNAITSLRTLVKLDFETIFEHVSVVHQNLSKDSEYLLMEFETRDYYRKCVSKIAKSIKASEPAVSKAAMQLASRNGEHVGEYIAGEKQYVLLESFGKLPGKVRLKQFLKRHILFLYVFSTAISTVISAGLLCISIFINYPIIYGILGFLISLIPIYTVAVAINNRIFMLINKPAFIPKMALTDGIPRQSATMVVIPTLITSLEDGETILEKMCVYYAANQQNNIYFALLSDFKDNKNEITADDVEIIERIEKAVESLNNKYDRKVFFYAQRKRTLISDKKVYSGKERKRGALLDFCDLLHGDEREFSHVTKGLPREIRYVITLDADTELSRDAAVKLVGAMMHPLNRPVIDSKTNVVKRGYGVMQPRIGIDVVSAVASRFSLIFSGKAGLDTYACATSDIYQDGFGTGIYTGKGIFDLDVYSRLLSHAFPDNAVLSHDLLEGSYLRCALVTDVVLMDGYPAKYLSWASRQHRWVRGDWQLLPWLGKTVRTKTGRTKNPLSGLAKYQIFDNMRRSLAVPFSFVVILLSQTAFYRSAFFWLISGVLPLFIDSLLDFAARMITLIRNAGKGSTFKDAWYETKTVFERGFYSFSFLAYETYLMFDAVVRTIIRVGITKKNMLEWVTAAEGEKKAKDGIVFYWRKMRFAPLLAVVLYALSIFTTQTFSIIAFILFALWFFAPSIAFAISRPRKTRRYRLDAHQRDYLEGISLKTWRFFERFSKESPYGWMPDNVQQSPKKGVAYRTSPTNIAFSMVSGIMGYYMGFCTMGSAIEQLDKCAVGIEKAEKWENHLYNWYDIRDLSPLEPKYVSSVDNGNIACYLVVANEAIKDMLQQPIAAYMQQGLSAVSRETDKELSFCISEDVFNAIGALDLIKDSDSSLGKLKRAFSDHIKKYARWAIVLYEFPQQRAHLYTEQTKILRDNLRKISIGEYIIEFHTLLEQLSVIYEKAAKINDKEVLNWVKTMETALGECYVVSRRLCQRVIRLGNRMMKIFSDMDFGDLYDANKGLFSIGMNVHRNELNDSHYDLLASEARQTGFIAIAKGDVPGKHWFRLSRPLTVAGESRVLLSWGGTMFEYLMPLLIMKSYDHTLLSETYRSVIDMQAAFAEQRRVPWGISESGYYAFDLSMNYQYKAFGIPSLGMKSGLVRETVISPYSTCLALLVNVRAALINMQRLEKIGAVGRYGFFEAIDYTQSRMQKGKRKRIVKSYMAHHQGMNLAALLNCLYDNKLQELFHSATCVKATEMLLKEKVPPRNVTMNLGEKEPSHHEFAEEIHAARTFSNIMDYPEAHFLSNGTYTVMLTQYGTGYSMYDGNMVNRWYSDCLRRAPGIHVYIKDTETGSVWSAAFLPTCVRSDTERVVFEQYKASFYRAVGDIETTLEICVSPECNMEVRSIDINNNSDTDRSLVVYCAYTPALCSEKDFEAHPAFAELFVDTQVDHNKKTIYARRRGKDICNAIKACTDGSVELLTDRTNIFGRQNILGVPSCMAREHGEHDVARAACIKCGVSLPAKANSNVSFVIAASYSMEDVSECLEAMSGPEDVRRIFHLAWTHSQVEMRYLKLRNMQANIFQKIASRTVIKIPPVHNVKGKADGIETLWKFGISGDLPIISLFAHKDQDLEIVMTVAKAQEFMSMRRVRADLVIFYDGGEQYLCPLRDKVKELAQATENRKDNRITALSVSHLTETDIATIISASCLVLDDTKSLMKQLKVDIQRRSYEVFSSDGSRHYAKYPKRLKAFDNKSGGFISNGTEYCIDTAGKPPLPWSNILVNPTFGSLISAGGGGYTWVDNARMTRLTPFRNDALSDISPEGVLVRNDRTGEVFSIMPDIYAEGKYRVTHGFGYSSFERYGGVDTTATFFVDNELPVKAGILRIANNTKQKDTFSIYYFAEPVLGATECKGVTAGFDGGLFTASAAFGDANRRMFVAMPRQDVHYTASSYEFFGTPGNNMIPEAMKVKTLSDSDGQGASILALQTSVCIKPGKSIEIPLMMGYGDNEQLHDMIARLGATDKIMARLTEVKDYWQGLVSNIKVSTTNKSFDMLVNGWLVYQTYAARLWGRTGYYQSGGAYGFRDQLQDVLALLYTNPSFARNHILKCAERQFVEGDVLHWWHEPTRGVRTKISDDKLFLPYVACEYARVTGDMGIFDENVRYLDGKPIPPGKHDLYEEFPIGETSENVFMHCMRAIESAFPLGEKGLPRMGTGDWNDGMDKIGEHGRGESVWLAFFLVEVLRMFGEVCRRRNENHMAAKYEDLRQQIKNNIEKNAWDGEWYMRAFFDDGTPIGSSESPECKIDIVSQAWAVISGAVRARRAYAAADEHLVMREEGIIRLLTPAFDKWEKDPGYIKGYLPGIRENGGQYTHAATWFVIAATKLRRKNEAIELFQMLNPINHTRTPAGVEKYKGEPYVMAADVYYNENYKGRAGWTWYTGTASWMYQAAIVYILGMRIENGEISIHPCVPDDFGEYTIEYKKDGAKYMITVSITPEYRGNAWLSMDDGERQKRLPLNHKEGTHRINACW